jgi:hypothetical protein
MRHGPRLSNVVTSTLRPLAAFALLAWSPAFAQTTCHSPPPGMSCPGDRLVWCNTPSLMYHFQGDATSAARGPASSYASTRRSVKSLGRRTMGSRPEPRRPAP